MSRSSSGAVFLDPTGTRWRRIRRIALAVGDRHDTARPGRGGGRAGPSAAPALVRRRHRPHVRRSARRRHLASGPRAPRRPAAAAARAGQRPPGTRGRPSRVPPRSSRSGGSHGRAPRPISRPAARRSPPASTSTGTTTPSPRSPPTRRTWIGSSASGRSSCRPATRCASRSTAECCTPRSSQPEGHRPLVFAMVSNYDSTRSGFDARRLRRAAGIAAAQRRVLDQLTDAVTRYGLAGVTVDFENVPDDLHAGRREFRAATERGSRPSGSSHHRGAAGRSAGRLARALRGRERSGVSHGVRRALRQGRRRAGGEPGLVREGRPAGAGARAPEQGDSRGRRVRLRLERRRARRLRHRDDLPGRDDGRARPRRRRPLRLGLAQSLPRVDRPRLDRPRRLVPRCRDGLQPAARRRRRSASPATRCGDSAPRIRRCGACSATRPARTRPPPSGTSPRGTTCRCRAPASCCGSSGARPRGCARSGSTRPPVSWPTSD